MAFVGEPVDLEPVVEPQHATIVIGPMEFTAFNTTEDGWKVFGGELPVHIAGLPSLEACTAVLVELAPVLLALRAKRLEYEAAREAAVVSCRRYDAQRV